MFNKSKSRSHVTVQPNAPGPSRRPAKAAQSVITSLADRDMKQKSTGKSINIDLMKKERSHQHFLITDPITRPPPLQYVSGNGTVQHRHDTSTTILLQVEESKVQNFLKNHTRRSNGGMYSGEFLQFNYSIKKLDRLDMSGGIYFCFIDLKLLERFNIDPATMVR